jgi:hypothetical protein
MQAINSFLAASIVVSVIAAWAYKLRYYAARPFCGLIAVSGFHLFCAYLIYAVSKNLFQTFLIYGLAQISSRSLLSVLNRIEVKWIQNCHDSKARQILETNYIKQFALYLRPFKVTDRLGFYGLSSKWGALISRFFSPRPAAPGAN